METTDIPASVSQRLLWMIKHYRADYGALNCPVVCRITGPLDLARLQGAVDALTARHDSLRTTFRGRGARLTQQIHPPRTTPLIVEDWAEPELERELQTPIDPQEWPSRVRLWRIAPDEHLFCFNLHHLVTDAWSTGILLRDLCLLYEGSPLPARGWSAAEYVHWQRSLIAGDQLRRHQDYWRRQLAGACLPKVSAAGGVERFAIDTTCAKGTASPEGTRSGGGPGEAAQGRSDSIDLAREVVSGLRELAKRENTTLFTVLLATFQAQLHRATGQGDISVASMFANRSRPELRETVGLLAGMVLLRAKVAEQKTFADLVRHCHSAVVGAFTYSDLPFQLLPGDLVDTAGGRADDVMFNVMTETRHLRTAGGVSFELIVPTEIGSRFPFELALVPVGDSDLRAVLFRAPDRLDAAGGASFLPGFAELAEVMAHKPESATRLVY